MGLKELKFPEATVKTPGGDITVRGLSLRDFIFLVSRHRAQFEELFAKVMAPGFDPNKEADAILQSLAASAPLLIAEVIAVGAGESGDAEAIVVASKIPFPVQVDALEKIGLLTFESEGGLKKVVETVVRIIQSSSNQLEGLNALKIGSGS